MRGIEIKEVSKGYKDTKALEIILSGEGREAARANVRGYYNLLVSRFR